MPAVYAAAVETVQLPVFDFYFAIEISLCEKKNIHVLCH